MNPVLMKKMIKDHPFVSRALIAGQNRPQAVLLVEPDWNFLRTDKPMLTPF
jgi:long-subunit acyl-CoA synthetase (AMP-forming)